jgi:hypothetical protein
MAPRDPILGLNEQFNADPNPDKVNLGVGRVLRRRRQAAGAALRGRGRAAAAVGAQGQRLPADRRHRRLRQGGAGPGVRRRQRRGRRRPRGHGAGPGRHRRPEGRRRLPEAPEPGRQGADQRPELGEPPRAVHQRRLHGRAPTPTTTPPRAASASTPCWPRCRRRRPAPSWCCTPAATTPPAATSRRRSGTQVVEVCEGPRPGALPGHGLPGLRRRHRRRRRGGAAVPGRRPGLLRLHLVLQELLALRRARRRAQRGVRQQGRGGARAVAAEDRHPHQLLQPAHLRRPGGGHRADHAGAARAVGRGAGRHARAHQGHARGPGGQAPGRRRDPGPVLHHHPEGHVQLLGL